MNLNSNALVLGEIKAEFFDQSGLSNSQRMFNLVLEKAKNRILPKLHGKVKEQFFKRFQSLYRLGNKIGEDEHKNIICNAGFSGVTTRLTGDTTYTGEINKALLGTGVGAVDVGDTELITEAYRNDMASASADENIAYLTAFFTESEVSGTFTEFGNCIDGTGTADTGLLWSHISGLNWVKDTNTALVISCKYTFASV